MFEPWQTRLGCDIVDSYFLIAGSIDLSLRVDNSATRVYGSAGVDRS